MASYNEPSTVKIFIADEQLEMRRLVRTALSTIKSVDYSEYKDFDSLSIDLAYCYPDLLIIDNDLPGGDIGELVRAIRHNEIGTNPFVPIVAMTYETGKPMLSSIISSGVDCVMLKPLSASAVLKYVNMLTRNRKPFVATSSYIGPDRRMGNDRKSDVPLIVVPNTLQAKRNGDSVSFEALHKKIAEEFEAVTAERLRSNAVEICRLLDLVLADLAKGTTSVQTRKGLTRMEDIARDLSERTNGGEYEHISALCDNLVSLTTKIGAGGKEAGKKDLQLIRPLCDAILAGMSADGQEADMAREISSSLSVAQG